MHCSLCASGDQVECSAEANMHFSGLQNLDQQGVLVFPNILVCLDCGFSRFTIPETELTRVVAAAQTNERSIRKGEPERSRSVGFDCSRLAAEA
jgi:hypothetical protein